VNTYRACSECEGAAGNWFSYFLGELSCGSFGKGSTLTLSRNSTGRASRWRNTDLMQRPFSSYSAIDLTEVISSTSLRFLRHDALVGCHFGVIRFATAANRGE